MSQAIIRLLTAYYLTGWLEWEGIDSERPGKHGRTPLSNAASMGHEEVVKLLQVRKSAKHGDT